jgi:hypothetical protein
MGTVIDFPAGRRSAREGSPAAESARSATIIILPVIRIERVGDEPYGGVPAGASAASGRRRRRPSSRS